MVPITLTELLDTMLSEGLRKKAPVLTLKEEANSPFEQLVFAVLSSRTRDQETIMAGRRLFTKVSTPEQVSQLPVEEIENLIKGVGFYRVKAKQLKEMACILVEQYNSEVPLGIDTLVTLPGVGRKTANIVLSASKIPAIAVDTHVHRIANRLGLVTTSKPEQSEVSLRQLFPKVLWRQLNVAFVGFGQTVCKPVGPLCRECPFHRWCPMIGGKK